MTVLCGLLQVYLVLTVLQEGKVSQDEQLA